LKKGGKMAVSQKIFTERAALWYVYKFEEKRSSNKERTYLIPANNVFDIVTTRTKSYDSIKVITHAVRFIEVKGMYNEYPVAFRLYDSVIRDLGSPIGIPLKSSKYWVYLVYNVFINEKPCLVILNSKFIRKHAKKGKDYCIHIHKVRDGIARNNLKIHELDKLTKAKKSVINNFFERL
jgi:hypothetical protein